MPPPVLNFEFYVGGIEDGILEVLTAPMKAIGVKTLTTYDGQLDSPEALREAINRSDLQYPFVMVGYAGGENVRDPATSTVHGAAMHFRHDCGFSVIVADDNSLGQRQRRRGKCYPMISLALEKLTGLRLKKQVEDDQYLLNTAVFDPVEVIPIAKLPDITAYGIPFETAFKWSSPDRSVEGLEVEEIVVGVNSLNEAGNRPVGMPGVETVVS